MRHHTRHPMAITDRRSLRRLRGLLLTLAALAAAVAAAPASAAAATGPQLRVTLLGTPTSFAPGDSTGYDKYEIDVQNVGDAPTDGSNIQITDTLPAGLTASSIDLYSNATTQAAVSDTNLGALLCTTAPVQCAYPGTSGEPPLAPGEQLRMTVYVANTLAEGASVTDSVAVSGGGAPDASASTTNPVSAIPAPFAVRAFSLQDTNQDGTPATQAAGHPYQLTTNFQFNTVLNSDPNENNSPGIALPSENVKDLAVDLPPGLIGNPQATPRCPLALFQQTVRVGPPNGFSNSGAPCPPDTQVGTITIFAAPEDAFTAPVYNLVPEPGKAAELGFVSNGGPHYVLTAGVRTGSDYGIEAVSSGIPSAKITAGALTIWGVPADPTHDGLRGLICYMAQSGFGVCTGGGQSSGAPANAFLTNPADCSAAGFTAGITADSWPNPGVYSRMSAPLPPLSGCGKLGGFAPTIAVAPDTQQAGAPAGLSVDLKVPQNDQPLPYTYPPGSTYPPIGVDYSPLAVPEVRDVTVALPQGMAINPSAADGLGSCSDAQFAVNSPDPGSCPDSSQIGTVALHTPLLDHPLPGDVYVGAPQCSPCSPADAAAGRMVRLFIQVNDPISGVIVKLPGTVSVDQTTGQLTSTFRQNPQLPFDELQLSLKGGPRAPLVNPSSCGTFTATSDMVPWSSPLTPDATPFSSFDVTGCGDLSTFSPSFSAGTQNAQAGSYSPFVLSFSRSDSDQFFQGLTVKMPPGVAAKLAGVPLCSDSDANAGTCPASSEVGTVETGAGAGSEPLYLPGRAFLTGPYKGGPYGLAVVVPAIAGPYNLGMVVVRQAIHVDPTTAQVTVVSDPFPQQLDGIPLRLRRVDVDLNRPDFTVNPTSCDPMAITGDLSSTGGMTKPMSSRFQVGGCQDLAFSPKLQFKLTGKGQTHSAQHPTLTATLTQAAGQANIRSAQVALPLSLALDTNNSSNVCNYDVAQAVHGGAVGCPANTIVGRATAVTPLLDKPLTGPVYLVQGIRFGPQGQRIHTLPSLLIPLRGQIALDLRAQSAVNGANQLVTTFSTIPDAPVSSFTLQINGGKHGILVITGRGKSICTSKQVANAQFGAQSGKGNSQNPRMATPACAGVSHHKRRKHEKHATLQKLADVAIGRLM